MSRSEQTQIQKPADFYAEWKGRDGKLVYRKDGETFEIPMPFTFLVLDQLDTVVGFDGMANKGYYSTEVRNSRLETIFVRKDGQLAHKGTWTDDSLKRYQDLKFAKSIYIAYYNEQKELRIGNIKATGSFRNAWFEFAKGKNIYEGAIVLTGSVQAKHGANVFFAPVFEQRTKLTAETEEAAKALDVTLQAYLRDYLHGNVVAAMDHPNVITESFSRDPDAAINQSAPTVVATNDAEDWDDIPF